MRKVAQLSSYYVICGHLALISDLNNNIAHVRLHTRHPTRGESFIRAGRVAAVIKRDVVHTDAVFIQLNGCGALCQ